MNQSTASPSPQGSLLTRYRALDRDQKNAFAASFLGWTLDAFDYFILVFVIKDVAKTFHTDVKAVTVALTLTLAMRPVGALLFGLAADRFGRRVPLMIDVVLFSVLELASGLAPSLAAFLVLRALFGVAMGGEWGLGASLALETAPADLRGALSGVLQEGYVVGYLLAAIVYPFVAPHLGWRWMFFVGALPALLALFIRSRVKESPVWQREAGTRTFGAAFEAIRKHFGLFVYLVILMTGFNFMSHGTQDLYPTFLQVQRHYSPAVVSHIAIAYNIGALLGGIVVGALSQRIGRRRAIILGVLIALPIVPLWSQAPTPVTLAVGAFLMQVMVQGAWGVIPAHLTELSPGALRGTFTGFAYQVGNLFASYNAPLQAKLAASHHNSYSTALAEVVAVALVVVALVTALGPEKRGQPLE